MPGNVANVVLDDDVHAEEDRMLGIALGLLSRGNADAGYVTARAHNFVVAARPVTRQRNKKMPVVVLPVVRLRRKVFGEDDGARDTCGDAGTSLAAVMDAWHDATANRTHAEEVAVRDKIEQLAERYERPSEGPIVVAGEDTEAVEACRLASGVAHAFRLCKADEVGRTGAWLLYGRRAWRAVLSGHRAPVVRRFDATVYRAHLGALRPGDPVTVLFDTLARDPGTSASVEQAEAVLTETGVRLAKPLLLPAVNASTSSADISMDTLAPWMSGCALYGKAYDQFRFSKRALLRDGHACVEMAGDAPLELWWPTPEQASSAAGSERARACVSLQACREVGGTEAEMLGAADHAALRSVIETAVAALGGPEDEASTGEAGMLGPDMESWRRSELRRLGTFLGLVRSRNAEDATYIRARLPELKKEAKAGVAKTLVQIGGAGRGVKTSADCPRLLPIPYPSGWQRLVNSSFSDATAPTDAAFTSRWALLPHGKIIDRMSERIDIANKIDEMYSTAKYGEGRAESSSVLQGHMHLADVVALRSDAGDSILYDHVRVIDANCIHRLAGEIGVAARAEAVKALLPAIAFAERGSDIELHATRAGMWESSPVADPAIGKEPTVVTSGPDYASYAGDAQDEANALESMILGIADMPHYRGIRVRVDRDDDGTVAASTPSRLLKALLSAAGIDDLGVEEEMAVMSNFEYYAPQDASMKVLQKQVHEIKMRRKELMERVRDKLGEPYEEFEKRLIARVRERHAADVLRGNVVMLAALAGMVVQRVPADVPGCGGKGAPKVLACAAAAVISSFAADAPLSGGGARKKPQQGKKRGPTAKDENSDLEAAISQARSDIEKDKPNGQLRVDKRSRKSSSVVVGAATEAWPHFRPSMHHTKARVNKTECGGGVSDKLVVALRDHVQSQSALMLGYNRQPLRNANSCCMHVVSPGVSAWELLAKASAELRALHRAAQSEKPSEAATRGVAPPLPCLLPRETGAAGADGWHAAGSLLEVAAPMIISAAPVERAAASAEVSIQAAVSSIVSVPGSVLADVLAPMAATKSDAEARGMWGGMEEQYARAFDTLAADAGVDAAMRNEMVEQFVRVSYTDVTRIGDACRVTMSFLRADLVPTLRRMADRRDIRDAEIAVLFSRLATLPGSGEMLATVSDLADGASGGWWDAMQVLPAYRGLVIAGYTCVMILERVSKLSPVLMSIAALLLRRWGQKLNFNRGDRRAEDDQAMKEEREKIKRGKLHDMEALGDEYKELLREYRKVMEVPFGAVIGKGGVAVVAEGDDGSPRPQAVEPPRAQDAREMYWSDGEGDDIDVDNTAGYNGDD